MLGGKNLFYVVLDSCVLRKVTRYRESSNYLRIAFLIICACCTVLCKKDEVEGIIKTNMEMNSRDKAVAFSFGVSIPVPERAFSRG